MSARPPVQAAAKEQVARLLTLVPFLHARGQVRLEDAASALGVDPEQLVRDLKVLLMCGLPGGYPDDLIDVDLDALEGEEGDGVIRVSNADYLARPLRLSPTEATAIIVALRALRNGAGDDTREVVDRALAKLEAAAAEGSVAAHIDPGDEPTGPDLTRLEARLREAAEQQRQVRLSYYVPSRDEQSERTVDPRGVVSAQGFTYLDAWCHSAEAPRLFRLDRIHEAEVLDVPDRDRAGGAARPRRRAVHPVVGHHDRHPAPRARRALGGGVLPGRGGPSARRRQPRGGPPRRRRAVAAAAAAPAGAARPGGLAPGVRRLLPRRRPAPRCACIRDAAYHEHCCNSHDEDLMITPMIANLGTTELLLILAVVILLFGAAKLPELARGSGRALRIFKAETKGLMEDDNDSSSSAKSPEQRELEARQQADLEARQAQLDAERERLRGNDNA